MTLFGTDVQFDPLVPAPLVLLLALGLGGGTTWAYLRTGPHLPLWRRLTLLGLRLAALGLVLLVLLQPTRIEPIPVEKKNKVTLVALDASRSMRQTDAGKLTRFDAARETLWEAGVVPRAADAPIAADLRVFTFGENAAPLARALAEVRPEARTTQLHTSVQSMLASLPAGEEAHALFLLTDGHDFELVNPAQTGRLARERRIPIYAVPYGGEGAARDVSVRITTHQPFNQVRQAIRIGASVRTLGYQYETLKVALLREGRVVQSRTVVVREEPQVSLHFDVTEEKPGQFEYEIRIAPLAGEADTANNGAITYLNVIDKKVRVLALEAQPYWDTTFLQRSLRRNDKLEVESVTAYAKGRQRVIRTQERKEPFRMPNTAGEWNAYDVVVLGRGVDTMLSAEQIKALEAFVDVQGGVVVFSRGDPFSGRSLGASIQPVVWGKPVAKRAPVTVGREGRGVAPFRLLADAAETATNQGSALPEMIGVYEHSDRKPLTATFAELEADAAFPAMIHRRQGAGQVLGIGVDGLWRWAFNARSEEANTVYDRFWDQTVQWLMRGRDLMPDTRYTFRADTANVLLGEKIRFRLVSRSGEETARSVGFTLFHENKEVARLACTVPAGGSTQRLEADHLPTMPGRYRAEMVLPDATRQTVRFAVFEDNVEETEVTTDITYLRRLAEASGGAVIKPGEFAERLAGVKFAPAEDAPRVRKITLWDRPWFFWLIGALFGADWYLRRRWGLC